MIHIIITGDQIELQVTVQGGADDGANGGDIEGGEYVEEGDGDESELVVLDPTHVSFTLIC